MKPNPWVGCRCMVTCRAEAGLRVPLSIPSWLSSNIAELWQTMRHESLRYKGIMEDGALCTCHMRSDVHPGPWPSPERREQHGTPLHCKAWALSRIHSPVEETEHGTHGSEKMNAWTYTYVRVYAYKQRLPSLKNEIRETCNIKHRVTHGCLNLAAFPCTNWAIAVNHTCSFTDACVGGSESETAERLCLPLRLKLVSFWFTENGWKQD